MEAITLNASTRVRKGKNESRRLRREGMVPAILYGSSQDEPVMLKLDQHDLHVLVNHTRGQNVLIDLTIDEKAGKTPMKIYLKDLQRNPVSGGIVHADLLSVSLSETVILEIPIHYTGTAVGTKEGGMVEHHLRSLQIKSLPQDAPNFIEVDISELDMNKSMHVIDMKSLAANIEILTPEDTTLASCVPPRTEEEEVVEGEDVEGIEDEDAEPEIIGKGKDKDEDEDKE